ncbi:MAG: hypothetical protein CL840_05525, partial [Crocinitomicaceae bacterium]|nr:hypothetical protein [Crocinitomicaceae bacterium]
MQQPIKGARFVIDRVYSHLFVFLLIVLSFHSSAQQFIYQNLTTDDGLPSSECYDVIQDKKGYIWVATDKGVARYNGQAFKVFDITDGLKSSVVFRLVENKGRIWFFTYNKYLQYIENDSVVTPNYSLKIKNVVDSLFAVVSGFSISDNNEILISLRQTFPPWFYLKIDSLENLLFRKIPTTEYTNINIMSEKGFGTLYGDYIREETSKINLSYLFQDELHHLNIGQGFKGIGVPSYSLVIDDKRPCVVALNNRVYVVNGNAKVDSIYTNTVLTHDALFKYANNDFIQGRGENKGPLTFTLDGDSISSLDSTNYDLKNISGGMIDRENSLWLTSLQEGVFLVKNPFMKSLNNLLGASEIIGIHVVNKELWVATNTNHLYSLDLIDLSIKQHLILTHRVFNLGGTGKSLIINTKTKPKEYPKQLYLSDFSGNAICSGDSIWFARASNLFLEVNGSVVDRSHFSTSTIPTIKCLYKWRKYIYLGSLNGLIKYSIEEKDLLSESDVNSNLNVRINTIIDYKDKLILATNGKGLLVLDQNDSVVAVIDNTNGLASNFCNSLFKQNDSTLWVSTNKGLNRINFIHSSDSFSFTTQLINRSNGLISEEVTHCLVVNNSLFVGTKKGLCYVDLRNMKFNNTPPKIYIERLVVSDSTVNIRVKNKFRYDKNDFGFTLSGLTYKTIGKYGFKYRLIKDGEPNNYVSLNQPFLQFADLSPGVYQFEVVAVNNNGVSSLEPATYNFTIFPPWWNTWWFRTLYIGGALSLLYSFLNYRYRQKKARDELNLTTKKLKQKALNAQ